MNPGISLRASPGCWWLSVAEVRGRSALVPEEHCPELVAALDAIGADPG